MAIQTIQETEVFIDGVSGYGYHRMQYMTRSVIANILERFFNKNLKSYQLAINNLNDYSNESSSVKQTLWILKKFPYTERKVPAVIVGLGDVKEHKHYIGTDSEVATWISPDGKRGETKYVAAADIAINIAIVAESPDARREISDLIYTCFTHYHRWHYFFKGDDDSTFSIVPSQGLITMGSDVEIKESSGLKNQLYIKTVNTSAYADCIFFDNLTTSKYSLYGGDYDYEIDKKSGTIPDSNFNF